VPTRSWPVRAMMRLPCRDLITITEHGKVCRAPGLPRRLAIVEALAVREGPVVMQIRAFLSFETAFAR